MKFKISYNDPDRVFSTKTKEFKNMSEVVSDFLEPLVYTYNSKKEYLYKKAETTEQLLSNLIDILTEKQILGKEELIALFNNKYEIENQE